MSSPLPAVGLTSLEDIVPRGTKRLKREQEVELFKLLEADRAKVAILKILEYEEPRAKVRFRKELYEAYWAQSGEELTPIDGGEQKRIERTYQLMVELNVGLIGTVIKRYKVRDDLREDAFQEAVFGIYRAVDKFEYKRGFRFSTYSMQWIRSKIGRAIEDKGLSQSMPIPGSDIVTRYGRRGLARHGLLSLDVPLSDEESMNLGDIISTPEPGPEEVLLDKELKEYVIRGTQQVVDKSNAVKRTRHIAELRLLADSPATLEDLGNLEGISKERVRQIEVEMKRQLKEKLMSNGYSID